jgi:O-glycosyl hydrolase
MLPDILGNCEKIQFCFNFSKLVRPGSIRIELTFDRGNTRNDLDGVAFITPDNQHVIVLQNRNMTATYQVSIRDADINGKEIRLDIEPRSLATLIWNKIA